MARFNPNHDTQPIYQAADLWRKTSLLADVSVLASEDKLWTSPLLNELDQRFVKNLDAGEGDFLSKLKAQLSEGSPGCRQLMAESLWLTLLFPSNIGAAKKRENVLEITEFALMTEERPKLEVVAVDIRDLAFGSGIPAGIDEIIPIERHWKQRSSQAAIYEAV